MPDAQVAIVGGGISGLYAAWRLSTAPNPPKIALFESSLRLGGRIDTAQLPVAPPKARADLGAMRFLPSMQMVSNLLQHLGVEREPFPGAGLKEAFLRGVQIDTATFSNLPYQLAGESANPGTLLVEILNAAVPNALGLSTSEWRAAVQNAKFKDRELWRWAVQNVAEECVNNEAYQYLCDISGLDSALLTSNAAIGLRCLASLLPDFAANQVFRPVRGFGSLITALGERLPPSPSCTVHTRHRLVSIRPTSDGVRLNFTAPSTTSRDATEEITADRLILAMPRRALELVDFSGLFREGYSAGRTELMTRLADVHGVPAFKLCVVYDQPWWQNYKDVKQVQRGLTDGCAVTDLPLRQVFFGLGVDASPTANARVLMATYADTRAAQYWRAQTEVSADNAFVDELNGEFHLAGPGNLRAAVDRQLRTLLQVESPLPEPLAVGFMNWSVDPYGGGWHEWNPGVDVTKAIPCIRHPLANAPVYICGEAYSWFQSWIEGALMSAERMLQDHFDMAWPEEWLPRDYDLGP